MKEGPVNACPYMYELEPTRAGTPKGHGVQIVKFDSLIS